MAGWQKVQFSSVLFINTRSFKGATTSKTGSANVISMCSSLFVDGNTWMFFLDLTFLPWLTVVSGFESKPKAPEEYDSSPFDFRFARQFFFISYISTKLFVLHF